jgi:membrane-bound ClpP family serine protease
MTSFIAKFAAFILFGACGMGGIFAAAGFCALIWGSAILDTALGSPPIRSHPAFITFLLLMPIFMLVGFAGGIMLFIAPAMALFPSRKKKDTEIMRAACSWFIRKTEPNQSLQTITAVTDAAAQPPRQP